jgi:hypothetical protein
LSPASPIEGITHEREFKLLCDGLLPFEFGPLVQTFAGSGRDDGVDAEFIGSIDGVTGRWVFQYKFSAPSGGLRERRSAVESCFRGGKARTSEFDKPGVDGCAGYVLLTNVPATKGMVERLKDVWTAEPARAGRPFVVWDVGALNARLKGREHLARSWSGAKEARCRQAIVEPLWRWTCSAMRSAADWTGYPLWPLAMQNVEERRLTPTFNAGFEWVCAMQVLRMMREVDEVVADPQFRVAAGVAYPRALEPLPRVLAALDVLAAALRAELDRLRPEIVAALPALDRIADERQREQVVDCLTFCVLELGWGVPANGLHSARGGRLVIAGRWTVYEGDAVNEMEPALDQMVAARRANPLPAAVSRARQGVAEAVSELWRRLWYVVEFGIDADLVELAASGETPA